MNDVYDFSTTVFEDAYNKALREGLDLKRESTFRRWAAYILKAVAIFGGIALATGLNEKTSQIVGIIIVIAVAIDTLFSNQLRLIVTLSASYAYYNLFEKVSFNYNNGVILITRLRDAGDNQKASEELQKLNQQYTALIYNNTIVLKEKIQKADLAFLNNLAQDKDKTKINLAKVN